MGLDALVSGAELTRFRRQVLTLIHEAGNPYYDWLFGSSRGAQAAIQMLYDSPSSELWAGRVRLLVASGTLQGLYLGIEGNELARCRLADTLSLISHTSMTADDLRTQLRARLNATRHLFVQPSATDYVLSKIAVTQPYRGQGVGRRLVDSFLEQGRALGYSQFRLDVSAGNERAITLYRSCGFEIFDERRAVEMSYLSMVREA